jgi:hypothetical protein
MTEGGFPVSPQSRPNFSAKFRSVAIDYIGLIRRYPLIPRHVNERTTFKDFPQMLVATRDHDPHVDARHFAPAQPPRTLASRFTGAVQLLGSLVGIPLALVGGYSTYHANFSAEAKCQALRGNIIAMLDRKADASTLRGLVHRDVVAFERDCGSVDADAVDAFKTLLVAERTPAARRSEPRQKPDTAERAPKTEAAVKVEKVERAEKSDRAEPAKIQVAAKPEAPKNPQTAIAPPKREPDRMVQEAKPLETSVASVDSDRIDIAWISSVRDALRESAARPPAIEPVSDIAPPLPPPAEIASAPRQADHPVPPAPIPNASSEQRGEN